MQNFFRFIFLVTCLSVLHVEFARFCGALYKSKFYIDNVANLKGDTGQQSRSDTYLQRAAAGIFLYKILSVIKAYLSNYLVVKSKIDSHKF